MPAFEDSLDKISYLVVYFHLFSEVSLTPWTKSRVTATIEDTKVLSLGLFLDIVLTLGCVYIDLHPNDTLLGDFGIMWSTCALI